MWVLLQRWTTSGRRVTDTNQVLGQYQLPLARRLLTSYFSDNEGDAVLGEDHLFCHGQPHQRCGIEAEHLQRGLELARGSVRRFSMRGASRDPQSPGTEYAPRTEHATLALDDENSCTTLERKRAKNN